MITLSCKECDDDIRRKILNTILDLRFYGFGKCVNKMYEYNDTSLDEEMAQDAIFYLRSIYTDEELKQFKENNYEVKEMCLYAYNFGSSYGRGRTISSDLLEKVTENQKTYISQNINILYKFKIFLEEDKVELLKRLVR